MSSVYVPVCFYVSHATVCATTPPEKCLPWLFIRYDQIKYPVPALSFNSSSPDSSVNEEAVKARELRGIEEEENTFHFIIQFQKVVRAPLRSLYAHNLFNGQWKPLPGHVIQEVTWGIPVPAVCRMAFSRRSTKTAALWGVYSSVVQPDPGRGEQTVLGRHAASSRAEH